MGQTQINYTGCCIHVTGVSLENDNSLVFTLSNGNTITTDTISVTGQASVKLTSGSVSGTNIVLTNSDASQVVVNASSLVNVYTAGTGIDIVSNVISVEPLTEVGSSISLINNKPNRVFKTISSTNSSLVITDNGNTLDFAVNTPLQYDITSNNSTTALSNRSSYFRTIVGVTNTVVILPPVISVPFGVEYHLFAGSDIIVRTTSNATELVPTVSAPHNYASSAFVDTLAVNSKEYYIIRKYSASAYIISKQ
jgi:hypothetical protein